MKHPFTDDPSQILLAGDWHGDLRHAKSLIGLAHEQDVPGIVQLGDFGIWPGSGGIAYLKGVDAALEKAGMWLLFVDGNHEDFTQLTGEVDDHGTRPMGERIWHLPRGVRWGWWDQKWLALGGATSLDRPQRRAGRDWWPEEAITQEDVERVVSGGVADLMLTHDCPAGIQIPGLPPASSWHPQELVAANAHRDVLRGVVDVVRPRRLWHGHFHVRHGGFLEGDGYSTRVTGLGDNNGPFRGSFQVVDGLDVGVW